VRDELDILGLNPASLLERILHRRPSAPSHPALLGRRRAGRRHTRLTTVTWPDGRIQFLAGGGLTG